jgi:hypothetical protein
MTRIMRITMAITRARHIAFVPHTFKNMVCLLPLQTNKKLPLCDSIEYTCGSCAF